MNECVWKVGSNVNDSGEGSDGIEVYICEQQMDTQ